MQWSQAFANADFQPLVARGRGLGKLIEGLGNGDPVAWSITIGAVVIFGGLAIYRQYSDSD